MYFYYGITHSTLENPEEEIELKVDTTYVSPPAQTVEQTAVWDRHGYENRMAEDGNSWNPSACWNAPAAGATNNGWGDQMAATTATTSLNVGNNYGSGSISSSRKQTSSSEARKGSSSASSKGSSGSSKTRSSKPAPPPPSKKPSKPPASTSTAAKATVSSASSEAAAPKKDGFGMFVEETHFPTWDD